MLEEKFAEAMKIEAEKSNASLIETLEAPESSSEDEDLETSALAENIKKKGPNRHAFFELFLLL